MNTLPAFVVEKYLLSMHQVTLLECTHAMRLFSMTYLLQGLRKRYLAKQTAKKE
jgi:hypothetical protein